MKSITVIPDIHADAGRLRRTLAATDPSDMLAFLGDFIDAGEGAADPADEQVLTEVRALVEAGRAVAVMGNHELNAILFHRTDGNGTPLRSRDPKNAKQHRSFCDAFGVGTETSLAWTEWFLQLPLWLDNGDYRLVHACWSSSAIEVISARRPDGRLQPEDLIEVAAKSSPFAEAVNLLLTGPEARLPDGFSFHDKGGHLRHHARIAWWRSGQTNWRNAALSVPNPEELPDCEISTLEGVEFYSLDESPVFVGHYKMIGRPTIETFNAACLDYPDTPCVYRWSGEARLNQGSLLTV